MIVTNSTIRFANEALNFIARSRVDMLTLSRVRVASKLLAPWAISVDETIRDIIQPYATDMGNGEFEVAPINRQAVEDDSRPYLAETQDIELKCKKLDLKLLHQAGVFLTLYHVEALEALELIEGAVDE